MGNFFRAAWLFLGLLFAGCTVASPGEVGLVVHLSGSSRGVEHTPNYGRIFYNPITTDVVVYPVVVQNVLWSSSPHEGSPSDESITFSVANGVVVNADVGMNFRVDPALAWKMYTRYRTTSLDTLADGQIRNDVRDCLNQNSVQYQVDEFLGGRRSELLSHTLTCVQSRQGPYGVIVENIAFTSVPRLPPNVQNAINASLEAQQAQVQARARAEAEVASARGHALALETEAEGRSRASNIEALAAANSLNIRTRADLENRRLMAEAYRALSPSLSPEVLSYLRINRWDGHLPPTYGGQTSMLVPNHTP